MIHGPGEAVAHGEVGQPDAGDRPVSLGRRKVPYMLVAVGELLGLRFVVGAHADVGAGVGGVSGVGNRRHRREHDLRILLDDFLE